jgi:hypothetical protein
MPRLTAEEVARAQRLSELDRLVRLIALKRARTEPPKIIPRIIPPPRPRRARLAMYALVRAALYAIAWCERLIFTQ